jgi:septal ring factor EnvC (AmiA/AmiB activator)
MLTLRMICLLEHSGCRLGGIISLLNLILDTFLGKNMKRYVLGAVLAAFLLVGAVGCGKKEVDELKGKVVQMEKDLAETRGQLVEKDKELTDTRAKLASTQAELESQTAQLVKIKKENQICKKDLTSCRKRLKS